MQDASDVSQAPCRRLAGKIALITGAASGIVVGWANDAELHDQDASSNDRNWHASPI